MRKVFFSFVLVLLGSSGVFTQSDKFTARINAEEVLEGYDFQISFVLVNAKGSSFVAPSFKDFKVVGGPSTSSQMSIVNGRSSQSMTYTYSLLATKPGNFTIPPASIRVGNQTIKSNSVKVRVLDNKQKTTGGGPPAGEELYIELELSDSTAYVGQQVLLKYVIYTSIDVRSYNFINESEYNGFYAEELQNYREKAVQVVRDGKQYIKQTLKAVSLFPQQTGSFDIDPALLTLGIAVKSQRPSFFFSTSMKSKRVSTESRSIQILPAPSGKPLSFSGAVGSYRMSANIDKANVSMDGAVTMTMNIEGDGDARFVSPPKQSIKGFEIYDPNLLTENSRNVNGKIRSTKSYEYLMVPQAKGSHIIRPEFSYYNVDSNKYITLYGPQRVVRVVGGGQNKVISTEDISKRIAPIATTTRLYKVSNPVFSPLHLGGLGVMGLGFMLLGLVKWRSIQQGKIDPRLLKSKKALKIAEKKLSVSHSHLHKGEVKEFYATLSDNLFSYISDKLDVPATSISKDTIHALFSEKEISSDIAESLSQMIKRSEMAIYAGFTPEKANEDYQTSKDIIVDIENALSK